MCKKMSKSCARYWKKQLHLALVWALRYLIGPIEVKTSAKEAHPSLEWILSEMAATDFLLPSLNAPTNPAFTNRDLTALESVFYFRFFYRLGAFADPTTQCDNNQYVLAKFCKVCLQRSHHAYWSQSSNTLYT
mmetsp:Transcript_10635/g.65576  ORF Transcript_10635/g.65576 Transcript_10635/m.65576 type:complete len:133 (-) Transcript_10635:833-1231(-)